MLDAVNMDDVSDSDPVKENSQESGASDELNLTKIDVEISNPSRPPSYSYLNKGHGSTDISGATQDVPGDFEVQLSMINKYELHTEDNLVNNANINKDIDSELYATKFKSYSTFCRKFRAATSCQMRRFPAILADEFEVSLK